MRNARQEAFDRLEGGYEVRVLEPSPPAVEEEPWFADDPTARGEVPEGRELVSPVTTGDLLWDDLAADDAGLAAWCAERWLGAYRRLEAPPPQLPRRVLASTAWPSTSSPRLGSARTARSPCATSPAGSGRPSSATTSRSASRAPSWSSIHPAASGARRSAHSPPRPRNVRGAARGRRRAAGGGRGRRAASSATGTGSRLPCSSSCAPRPPPSSRPRGRSCGPSTSTSPSSWARRPPGPGRVRRLAGRRAAFRALSLRRALGGRSASGRLWNAAGFTGAELSYAELLGGARPARGRRSTSSAAACARSRPSAYC